MPREALDRSQRLRIAFGRDGAAWDEEKVLERYELLCEAGLAGEAAANGDSGRARLAAAAEAVRIPCSAITRRVLASAIGELRRSVKCEPVIFELMPDVFTLFELQKTVEAILGPHLHKQNFRRLVEGGGLVEPTGRSPAAHRRPAGPALPLPSRRAAGAPGSRRPRQGRTQLIRGQCRGARSILSRHSARRIVRV